jgi:hypothetical protein
VEGGSDRQADQLLLFLFHWEAGGQQKRKMEEKGREMVRDVRERERIIREMEGVTSGGVE